MLGFDIWYRTLLNHSSLLDISSMDQKDIGGDAGGEDEVEEDYGIGIQSGFGHYIFTVGEVRSRKVNMSHGG